EGAAVPFARVVAKPFEHPFVSPVGAGDKTVEGHHHFENYFSIGHIGRDLRACMDSSLLGGSRSKGVSRRPRYGTCDCSGEGSRSSLSRSRTGRYPCAAEEFCFGRKARARVRMTEEQDRLSPRVPQLVSRIF